MIPKTPAIAAPKPKTAAEGRDPTPSAVELLAVWAAASDEGVVGNLVVRVRVVETRDEVLESAPPTKSLDVVDAELLSLENDVSVAVVSSAPV